MEIDVLGTLDSVEIGATGLKEIIQNVQTILTTVKWSVPLDRDFGLDADLLDKPLPVAQAKLTGQVVAAIETYEPRAKVVVVSFVSDADGASDGRLIPKVRLKIDDSAGN